MQLAGAVELGAREMENAMTAMTDIAVNVGASLEQAQKLDAFVEGEMKSISAAKEEYMALMGGEKPSFEEVQKFIKFKKSVIAAGRQDIGIREPGVKVEVPNLTRYPYDEWDGRGACCVCPPCAFCPGFFTCPIECPLLFPCTIFCPFLKKPPCGLPKMNPCCKITYLCKPVELACSKPCLVIHPCNLNCCCSCPSCPSCCGFKTIGLDCKCCHCTFAWCPSCCPTPCCAKEMFTDMLHITRSGAGAPPPTTDSIGAPPMDEEMER